MAYKYVFNRNKTLRPAPHNEVLAVSQNNVLVMAIPLHDKIVHKFAFDQLVNWLGRDNAANIMVSGEEVTLVREQPIDFDFSRFKP